MEITKKIPLIYQGRVSKLGRLETLIDFDVLIEVGGEEMSIKTLLSTDQLRNAKLEYIDMIEEMKEKDKQDYEAMFTDPDDKTDQSFDSWKDR